MTLSGGTDTFAARVAQEFNTVRAEIAALPPGGALGGWVDCSQLTTAAAINAAANPAVAGDNATIWLGPRATPLVVDETLIVWGGQTWLGAGGRELHTTLQAGPSLPAGHPIMAAEGWFNDAPDADEPITVRGIKFDLNGMTGRSGLIIYNFWSWVDDCQFSDADGAEVANLLQTDVSRNGTVSANSHSENRYTGLRFDGSFNGARHFYSVTTNGISNQDGHIADSFFAGSSGPAIHITRAAGWSVENNHLYGVGDNAIYLQNCYATKVLSNYIEDFGRNNVTTGMTNGYYSGIGMSILDGKPSIVALNTVSLVEPDPAPLYNRATCIGVRAGVGQMDARVVVMGNALALDGDAVGTNSEAFRIGEGGDTGRLLHVTFEGNQIDPRGGFASQIFRSNSTTRIIKDPVMVRSFTGVTGAVTLDAEFETVQNYTCTGDVTVSPPTTLHSDREPIRLAFLASGGARNITFAGTIRTSTGITSRTFAVPSGQILLAAIEYSSLVGAYTLTAATVSAT